MYETLNRNVTGVSELSGFFVCFVFVLYFTFFVCFLHNYLDFSYFFQWWMRIRKPGFNSKKTCGNFTCESWRIILHWWSRINSNQGQEEYWTVWLWFSNTKLGMHLYPPWRDGVQGAWLPYVKTTQFLDCW